MTTKQMIAERMTEARILREWLKSDGAVCAPLVVWVAVQKQIKYCNERIKLLEGSADNEYDAARVSTGRA